MPSQTHQRYTSVAIAFHWLIAACIIGLLIVGVWMTQWPPADRASTFALYQAHKSLGLTVLLLTIVRLGWRIGHRPPPLPTAIPAWEQSTARAVHWAFYGLLIVIPLLGWGVVSAAPLDIPTRLFGLIDWPSLSFIARSRGTESTLAGAHGLLACGLTLLLVVHVGAALKHHLRDRDQVLTRMIPFLIRRS